MSDTVRPGMLSARLTRLAMWAAALALLVAGAALNLATYLLSREALVQQSLEQARLVATNLTAAVAFGDQAATRETLGSLAGVSSITAAQLTSVDGGPLARYERAGAGRSIGPGLDLSERLQVAVPVLLEGRPLASLSLEVDTSSLVRRGLVFGGITLAVGAVALAMAWLFALGVRRDVSRVEQRLDDLAHRDPVTQLFNRHAATSHLEALVRGPAHRLKPFAVVTIDLDDFKLINDTLGHAIGDQVLACVGQRLQQRMPSGGQAYRFGGDEFVVVSPCPDGQLSPVSYQQLVLEALAIPPLPEAPDLQLSGSVGVARFPGDAQDVAELLQASDIAMYAAKQRGKNQVVVFEPGLRERNEQWMQTANDLHAALRRGELRLHYQPIVELAGGRIVGAEALVRWEHPQRGWLLPGDFIPVAERSGLIADIGGWVLQEATRQWVRWRDRGLGALELAVNVSPRQLRRGVLQQQFEQAIADSQADPRHITLELTEHSLVEHADGQLGVLERLRAQGVQVAIDDFGTGLSSLSYLKRLPVTKLKIDRSFVSGLTDNGGDATIVGATLAMASAFGLKVVAEGIETEAQQFELQQMGCDFGQGYLYSRPVSPADFERLLRGQTVQARSALADQRA
ncbi:MAG: EAL domain-containing protein [Burkholderiales bacterium]|nr:EAL domain-containing protein [Burkholderiales bacterium]